MQCYIMLYSKEGYFLIFEKREEGFFFEGTNGGQGVIYPPDGHPIVHGPGLYAFPGGKLHKIETPFKGCLREFTEECGNQISFDYTPPNQLETLTALSSININRSSYKILFSILNTVPNNYHTLYLNFETSDLRQIQNIVTNTNFVQANQVRSDIHNTKIRSYNAIFQRYPYCPSDDELGHSELWQIEREINEIRLLRTNQATDWCYDMIVYLANTILHARIPY